MLATALTYGPWAVVIASIPLCILFLDRVQVQNTCVIILTIVLFVVLVQIDGIVLGPHARGELGDGQELFYGYFPYLAQHRNELFLPALGGGSDRYALGRIGGEFLSLRVELVKVLPLWAVLVILRIIIPAIAALGIWLFATRVLNTSREMAIAVACLYAVGFEFTTGMTFLYGLTFSGLPFLLYVLFSSAFSYSGVATIAVVALVYISAAEPIYGLPNFLVAAAATATWVRPRSWTILLGGISVLVIAWPLNFAETIYGYIQFLPYSSRLVSSDSHHISFDPLITLGFTNAVGVAFVTSIGIAAFLIIRAKKYSLLPIVAYPVLILIVTATLQIVPWNFIGLGFLHTYRWHLEYGAIAVALLVLCASATYSTVTFAVALRDRVVIWAAAVILAIALGEIVYFRLSQIGWLFHRGNLAAIGASAKIKPAEVGIEPGYRVVSIPSQLDPNFAVNAGLDNYDVATELVNSRLFEYWKKGIQKYPGTNYVGLAQFARNFDFESCCDALPFANYADVDLLKIANVRYVLTYRRLSDASLRQISGPNTQTPRTLLQNEFGAPLPLFIYEIKDALPRAFAARSIKVFADNTSIEELLSQLRHDGLNRSVALDASSAQRLLPALATDPSVDVRIEPVVDGYAINLTPHTVTLIVVNVPYFVWWKARTPSGRELAVAPANIIHTVVMVPPDESSFKLIYERPTFLIQRP